MSKLYNMFYRINMSWIKVIILSLVCGVIPGLLMIPDFLIGTSLQNPGISYEFWVFMALLIALNCKKPVEAGLKTFVFFLISQPIIYLVQVPFSWMGWNLFSYYPFWAVLTLFTLPGGMLAWFVKKGNWLSVAILSVANILLCNILVYMFADMLNKFPKGILSLLFITFEIIFFTCMLLKGLKLRIVAFAVALVAIIASSVYLISTNVTTTNNYSIYLEGNAPFHLVEEIESPKIKIDGNMLTFEFTGNCDMPVSVVDADGKRTDIHITYEDDAFDWDYAD